MMSGVAFWTIPDAEAGDDSARSGFAWLAAADATTSPAASSRATTTLRMAHLPSVTRHRTAPQAKAGGAAVPATRQKTVS